MLADYPAGTYLKMGTVNASVLPKMSKQQRLTGGLLGVVWVWRGCVLVLCKLLGVVGNLSHLR